MPTTTAPMSYVPTPAGVTVCATGTMYLGKTKPTAGETAGGQFQLVMLLIDRVANLRREPWRVSWVGPQAHAFWQQHKDRLTPGQPVAVRAYGIRAHHASTPGTFGPEIHAHLYHAELLPTAWEAAQNATQAADEQEAA